MNACTEAEAKTKWCPFTRVIAAAKSQTMMLPAGNRIWAEGHGGREIEGSKCIASACMAWQWDAPASRTVPVDSRGFCGLART